jgi:hypothetical protein
MSLVAGLVYLTLGPSRQWWRSQQVQTEAEIMLGRLQEARELARRNGAPVRVVFSLPQADAAERERVQEPGEGRLPHPAVATGVFTIPVDLSQVRQRQAPTATTEGGEPEKSRLSEWLPVTGGPRPEAFVGQWIFAPGLEKWERLEPTLQWTGEVFTRFAGQGGGSFAADNFFRPPTVWSAADWTSPYPANYAQISFPPPRAPQATLLSDEEKWPADETLPRGPIRDTFGPGPWRHFPTAVRAALRPQALPALEFLPSGALAATWTETVKLRVQPWQRERPFVEIWIETASGQARLVQAEEVTP